MKDLDSIYFAALELPPEQRAAWLAQACGDDVALRARVEQMLAVAEKAEAFIADPPRELAATLVTPPSEQPGTTIGPFKLREQIGEGGFGTVWVADQEHPVRRRVALKIIKPGMDTKEVIARFEQERQALAVMDHPNIAKVLDAGTTDQGRPYFVMELVRGVKITDYCDEQQLSMQERISLFITVCHAVQHAHQKGIIHRDLKPSNILVSLNDGVAVPKVIDFGVAKATQGRLTEGTIYTEFEQMIGTPLYMSPEQAQMTSLDIDTRADIYALGVMLYELLTSRTPIDQETLRKAGMDEMRRLIREVDPPRPSTRVKSMGAGEVTTAAKRRHTEPAKFFGTLRGDLDWIVMKCLEKDRKRRYDSATGLATDLQRHLGNEVVTARPPTAGYLLSKLIRRHRLAFAAGTAVVVSLVLGITAATIMYFRERDARKQTAAERDKKEEVARIQKDTVDFLTDVFKSPDPSHDGSEVRVVELLDDAAAKLETSLTTLPEQRAVFQLTLGKTYYALSLPRKAIPLFEKARDYFRSASGPGDHSTLTAMRNLAAAYFDIGRRDEALKLREEVLEQRRKVNGPEDHETFVAMYNVAVSLAAAGRKEEALKLHREVLAISRRVNGPVHADTLAAMVNLAESKLTGSDEMLSLREAVLALRRNVLGPEHPDTVGAMIGLGNCYFDLGRGDDALKLREEILPLCRKVNGPLRRATLWAMQNLAVSYFDAGRRDESVKLREEVLALYSKMSGPEHPDTLVAMLNLAESYHGAGRKEEALRIEEEVLRLYRSRRGPEHQDTIRAMTNLATSYLKSGRGDEALKLQEEALPLYRKVFGAEDRETLGAMTNLAFSYGNAGRLPEAIKLQEQALALKRRVLPPDDPFLVAGLANMARLYDAAGRGDEALKVEEEALATRRKASPEHRDTLVAMTRLSISYLKAGRSEEALKLREEALPLCRKVLGAEDRETLGAMTNLALSYGEAGRLPEALKLQEEALALKRRVLKPDDPYLTVALRGMARLYKASGREEEAAALLREVSAGRTEPFPAVAATLVPPDSEWKWLHPVDGVDPATGHPDFHTTFFTPGYDDSAWKSGKDSADASGGFGYGHRFTGVDIGLPPDENHRHSAYFRHRFTTDKLHARLELRCQRDDAIIIYLDGKEVVRDNLPAGPDAYLLSATMPLGPDNDGVIRRFPIPGTLSPGEHLLAISVHNTELPSSDLRLGGVTLVETAE